MASDLRRKPRVAGWGVALLVVAAALVWAAAPAISLGPYTPKPVNFEQELPSGSGATARSAEDGDRARYLTAPFAAPKRFDLVGLTGTRGHADVRVREAGGEWSDWVEISKREPVWTGGSEEIQVRGEDGHPGGELAYVNVSGDATGGDRALTAARGAVNSAFVTVASLFASDAASADAPFEIVNRREWDPDHACVPKGGVALGKVKAGVVHHTVNANDYTPEEASGVVLAICRYHRYSNGWNDIGYNALVDRFGNLYAGRNGGLTNPVIGAHTAGFNTYTFGVASIGDHRAAGLSKPAIGAITNLLAWKLSLSGVDGVGKTRLESGGGAGNRYPAGTKAKAPEVTRHRKFNETSCPGRAQLKKILRKTQKKIATGQYTPPPEPPPPDDGGVPVLP